MRLWMLTCELAHEVAGGIARYVENFSRLAGSAGHEVTILGRAENECDCRPAPGVRMIGFRPRCYAASEPKLSLRPDDHASYPYNVVGYAQALSYEIAERTLELLRREPRPDVIECHEYMALPYFLLQRKLTDDSPLADIPIVVHMHGPSHELLRVNQEPRFRFPEWWTGQMEKASVVMADAVLSPSHFLANRIRELLGPGLERSIDVERIPYPVDDRAVSNGETAQPGEIVYVGRLQLLKGVLPLLAACARMWHAGKEFRLTMVGGDTRYTPRNTTVREYIEKKYARWIAAGRLKLPGPMPYEKVLATVRSSWAAVVPSLWENFPNVCIEAMMSGTVVLGSTSGGQAEMIGADGEFGYLFDWNQPGAFERQLERVLALPDERRAALAQRARERIHDLCAPQTVLALRFAHFERVVRSYRRPTRFPLLQTLNAHRLPQSVAPLPATWSAPPPVAPPRTSRPGLLSVVIPFYNLGEFVGETLASIRASTYHNIEILLVNDGSTDPASLALLKELEAHAAPDLRIVHTENCGLAQTRNNGADHAQGEYLCFLDADDCVEPEYFKRAIRVMDAYANVDFICSWIRCFGEQNEIWPVFSAEFPYLLGHNMCTAFAVMRRSTFERCGRNKPIMEYALEDHEMWISLLAGGAVGVALCDLLVRYRVRKGSMLQSSTHVQQLYLYDILTQLHPELFREWGVELFNLQNANGPGRIWNHPAMECPVVGQNELQELRNWLREVEGARDWSEGQRVALLKLLDEKENLLSELRNWLNELQAGKDWLEREWIKWQAVARTATASLEAPGPRPPDSAGPATNGAEAQVLERRVQEWKKQFAFRALRKLGLLRDLEL